RRKPRGSHPFRQGRHEGGRAQSHEVFQGRELRAMHAVPQWDGKGGDAHVRDELEQGGARRSRPGHGRCLDLWAWAGGAQSAAIRLQILPGGFAMTAARAVPTVQIDNDRVRVTEWRFAPGAETGFHVHEMDY